MPVADGLGVVDVDDVADGLVGHDQPVQQRVVRRVAQHVSNRKQDRLVAARRVRDGRMDGAALGQRRSQWLLAQQVLVQPPEGDNDLPALFARLPGAGTHGGETGGADLGVSLVKRANGEPVHARRNFRVREDLAPVAQHQESTGTALAVGAGVGCAVATSEFLAFVGYGLGDARYPAPGRVCCDRPCVGVPARARADDQDSRGRELGHLWFCLSQVSAWSICCESNLQQGNRSIAPLGCLSMSCGLGARRTTHKLGLEGAT